jgi:hypothetical protein
MHGYPKIPNADLKPLIANCKLLLLAWCLRLGCHCLLATTDLHVAGSPCVDASSLGSKQFMDGPTACLFFIWVALVRRLLFKVILHENVPQFGEKPLKDALSDLYVIARFEVTPVKLGWPIRRPRQITLMVLRTFMRDSLPSCPAPLSDRTALSWLNFVGAMQHIFHRRCGFHFREFRIATPEEIAELISSLRKRSKSGTHDHDGSVAEDFSYMTPTEADRVCRYSRISSFVVFVAHTPPRCPQSFHFTPHFHNSHSPCAARVNEHTEQSSYG